MVAFGAPTRFATYYRSQKETDDMSMLAPNKSLDPTADPL